VVASVPVNRKVSVPAVAGSAAVDVLRQKLVYSLAAQTPYSPYTGSAALAECMSWFHLSL